MIRMIHLHRTICLIFLLSIIFSFVHNVSLIWANDDFIIVLDQSKSMKEKIPGNPSADYEKNPFKALKSKGAIDAINHVVNNFLKEGDYFSLIIFGSKAELLLSQEILYKHERELIKKYVESLIFEDQRTDIVAGIRQASELIASLDTPQRRKILIIITDGVNDPPSTSPYVTQEQQDSVFQQVRETIRFNKWDVTLVGLGEHTDINNIADRLGLPLEKAIYLKDHPGSDISKSLTGIIEKEQKSVVKMSNEKTIEMQPKLFGGYKAKQAVVTLESFFTEKTVQIKLNTVNPLTIQNNNHSLTIRITDYDISLPPQKTVQLLLHIAFNGDHPEHDRIITNFSFNFAEGSTFFYPYNGSIELTFVSWWEVFGRYAVIATCVLFILFILLFRAIRNAQVPEIRISVTGNDIPLGNMLTLKRKETFMIANGYFEGKSVSAKGLNCKTAAKVQYLGKRKFSVESVEAKIVEEGKEVEKINIGMDKFFGLKDKDGKILRLITFTSPGRESDYFGGTHGNDPF